MFCLFAVCFVCLLLCCVVFVCCCISCSRSSFCLLQSNHRISDLPTIIMLILPCRCSFHIATHHIVGPGSVCHTEVSP